MGMMPACTIPSSGLALSSHFHLQNRTCLPGSSGIAGPEWTPASRPAPVLANCLCLRTVILTSLLLAAAPWIYPMHWWWVSVPKGVLQSYHSPNQNLSVVSYHLQIKPKHLNLGFQVLSCWVIFQPVFIEYQLDAVHCGRCWRHGSLIGHNLGPNWTFHYRMWHSKQSHITQCLWGGVCQGPWQNWGKLRGKKGAVSIRDGRGERQRKGRQVGIREVGLEVRESFLEKTAELEIWRGN